MHQEHWPHQCGQQLYLAPLYFLQLSYRLSMHRFSWYYDGHLGCLSGLSTKHGLSVRGIFTYVVPLPKASWNVNPAT